MKEPATKFEEGKLYKWQQEGHPPLFVIKCIKIGVDDLHCKGVVLCSEGPFAQHFKVGQTGYFTLHTSASFVIIYEIDDPVEMIVYGL